MGRQKTEVPVTYSNSIGRLALLLATLGALGCAKGTISEPVDPGEPTQGEKWRPLFVSKSDVGRAGVEVAVQLVELAPGETPEQAAMRVFGTPMHGDVAGLLGGNGRPIDHSPAPAPADGVAVCNDACRFANDGVCDEPRHCATGTDCGDCSSSRPGSNPNPNPSPNACDNSCAYANDGMCDEPTSCAEGTDCADCRGSQPEPSPPPPPTPQPNPGPVGHQCLDTCRYANDGVCDVPTYCAVGTDCNDCSGRGAPVPQPSPSPRPTPNPNGCDDSCRYANDGVCDVPDHCASGSDCTDCGGREAPAAPPTPQPQDNPNGCDDSCRYAHDGVCDVPDYCPVGSDCSDCGGRSAPATPQQPSPEPGPAAPAGPDSCRYARDGACDEPRFCAAGTDTTDCAARGGAQPSPNPAPDNGPDSCRWAGDGECDEPRFCAVGTDSTDCAGRAGGPPSPPSPGGCDDSCRYAGYGVCDEPVLCAGGTDCSDCGQGGGGATPPPPTPPPPSPPAGGSCDDSCRWAHDGECDDPGLCSPGTDCGDCGQGTRAAVQPKAREDAGKKRPEKITFAACFAEGHEGICRPEPECIGRGVPGVCPGGADYRCCLPADIEPTTRPGLGQRCDTEGFVGLCVVMGECGAVGLTGPCGSGLHCCAEDGVKEKAAVTGTVALVAFGTRAVVFAYRTYRAYRATRTAIGVVQTLNSMGQDVQVEVTTNVGSITAARDGAFGDGRAVLGSQGVGSMSRDYFTDRAREATSQDGLTCSPATRTRLNDQKNYNCKYGGQRHCPTKAPWEQGGLSCEEIQNRLRRSSRCVNDRRRLNDVCYGGLGHPDDNNQRGDGDPPLDTDIRAVQKCQQQYAAHCTD